MVEPTGIARTLADFGATTFLEISSCVDFEGAWNKIHLCTKHAMYRTNNLAHLLDFERCNQLLIRSLQLLIHRQLLQSKPRISMSLGWQTFRYFSRLFPINECSKFRIGSYSYNKFKETVLMIKCRIDSKQGHV